MATVVIETLLLAPLGWILGISVICDGEPFEFQYDVAPPDFTEAAAREFARRRRYRDRALRIFLASVHLETKH